MTMRALRRVFLEAIVVVVLGVVVGAIANGFSPVGIDLGREYFPGARNSEGTAAPERLRSLGVGVSSLSDAERMYSDPRYQQELIVFIDARRTTRYQQGHIPGAYQLDHYHLENYLEEVLPACQSAETILIYCKGGNCEDSEFAARDLIELGIDPKKMTVFLGGLDAWQSAGHPIESGDRLSGSMLQ